MTLFVYQIQGCFSWQSRDVTTWYHPPPPLKPPTISDCAMIVPIFKGLASVTSCKGMLLERAERKKRLRWSNAIRLSRHRFNPTMQFGGQFIKNIFCLKWLPFLHLQKERGKEWAKEIDNKQYFKYRRTHLSGDIISSHIQSFSHLFSLSFEDNSTAVNLLKPHLVVIQRSGLSFWHFHNTFGSF